MPIPKRLNGVLVAIKPQETVLFSTADRNPGFKPVINREIAEVEMIPAAKRIYTLITGGHTSQSTVAELQMAWEYAQMSPVGKRLMKAASSLPPAKASSRSRAKV